MSSAESEFPGVALVTGAGGSGIGAAVARAFIQSGLPNLIITDINPTSLQSVQSTLQTLSPTSTILAVPGDISDPSFIDHLFETITSQFGRLDYGVNCAGIIGDNKSSTESSLEAFDRINGVNYRGLWMCSRKELSIMKGQEIKEREGFRGVRRQRGSVVNIASQLGVVGRPDAPIYCASKSAIIGLTRCDAIDYSPFQIRINAVCPGIIDTPMTYRPPSTSTAPPPPPTSGAGAGTKAMDLSESIDIAPMKRMGTAEEVADVCLFLCSEKASFVQGAAWVVDGGYTIN